MLDFAFLPSFMLELQQNLLPIPASCEGFHCQRCHSPVLKTDSPMDFYDEEHFCNLEEPEEDQWSMDQCPMDTDALDAYIDYMLDCDYDW